MDLIEINEAIILTFLLISHSHNSKENDPRIELVCGLYVNPHINTVIPLNTVNRDSNLVFIQFY